MSEDCLPRVQVQSEIFTYLKIFAYTRECERTREFHYRAQVCCLRLKVLLGWKKKKIKTQRSGEKKKKRLDKTRRGEKTTFRRVNVYLFDIERYRVVEEADLFIAKKRLVWTGWLSTREDVCVYRGLLRSKKWVSATGSIQSSEPRSDNHRREFNEGV